MCWSSVNRDKMAWAMLVPRKGKQNFTGSRGDQQNSLISLGTTELHSDATAKFDRGVGKGSCTSSPRRKPDCDRKTTGGRELVHRNHRTHGGTRGWPGQNTQSCIGAKVPPDARILCWLVEFAA